jgi:transposase
MIPNMNRLAFFRFSSSIPGFSSTIALVSTQQDIKETVEQVRAEKDLVIASLQAANAELTKKLEAALYRIDQMSRRLFGRSSESYDHPDQLRLDLGVLTPAAPAGPVTVIPPEAKGIVPGREICAGKAKRKPIPDTVERIHLAPRELTLAERTLSDGRVLEPIGEETNERLHVIPMQIVAEVEHCIVYGILKEAEVLSASLGTDASPLAPRLIALPAPQLVAPPAPQIIFNGLPTTALLIQVAFQKYGLHLPLHRQAKEFARLGCDIAKSTMCGWLMAFSAFLLPVIKALERQVLASDILFSDDIPEDMLDPGSKKTKQVRFWSYLGSGPGGGRLPQVIFSFSEDRCGRHPSDMLKDFFGVLMADALAQYDKVVALNLIVRLLCWAHVRREFYQARHTDPRCLEMVLLIKILYAAEERAQARAEREQLDYRSACRLRWRYRKLCSARVLKRIKARLDEWEPLVGKNPATPDSPLGKAVMYALPRWGGLAAYAETGDLPIDNNPAENVQRPIAVGRKNHLFIGSEDAGEMAATFYSLIQSCRLQKIDPVGYLAQVSGRLLAGETVYDQLTPGAVAEAQRKAAAEQAKLN